jgi:hypothetical protein
MTLLMSHPTSSVDTQPRDKPKGQKWIDMLFTRLNAQLGGKMADLFVGVQLIDLKTEWAMGLAGFTSDEIERGLLAMARRTFAPTLGEFSVLCRPCLEPEVAWTEASEGLRVREGGDMGQWSHPAVYRAAMLMHYEIRQRSFKEFRKSWDCALQREFAKGWVADVPVPLLRIVQSAPTCTARTPEQKAALAEFTLRMKSGRVFGDAVKVPVEPAPAPAPAAEKE